MYPLNKLSVPVEFTEGSERSLKYVLSFAKEIGAEFIVLQVIEKNVERYSLIFSVALLERWPFAASSVAAIPVDALQQQKNIDLAGIIQRIMKTKRQPQFRNNFAMGVPVKVLAASFQDEKIDMVIFELGRQLPFPQLAVVQLLKIIEKLPYPVLLTPPQTKKSREPRGPLGLVPYPKPRRKSLNRPLWTGITVAGRPKEVM